MLSGELAAALANNAATNLCIVALLHLFMRGPLRRYCVFWLLLTIATVALNQYSAWFLPVLVLASFFVTANQQPHWRLRLFNCTTAVVCVMGLALFIGGLLMLVPGLYQSHGFNYYMALLLVIGTAMLYPALYYFGIPYPSGNLFYFTLGVEWFAILLLTGLNHFPVENVPLVAVACLVFSVLFTFVLQLSARLSRLYSYNQSRDASYSAALVQAQRGAHNVHFALKMLQEAELFVIEGDLEGLRENWPYRLPAFPGEEPQRGLPFMAVVPNVLRTTLQTVYVTAHKAGFQVQGSETPVPDLPVELENDVGYIIYELGANAIKYVQSVEGLPKHLRLCVRAAPSGGLVQIFLEHPVALGFNVGTITGQLGQYHPKAYHGLQIISNMLLASNGRLAITAHRGNLCGNPSLVTVLNVSISRGHA